MEQSIKRITKAQGKTKIRFRKPFLIDEVYEKVHGRPFSATLARSVLNKKAEAFAPDSQKVLPIAVIGKFGDLSILQYFKDSSVAVFSAYSFLDKNGEEISKNKIDGSSSFFGKPIRIHGIAISSELICVDPAKESETDKIYHLNRCEQLTPLRKLASKKAQLPEEYSALREEKAYKIAVYSLFNDAVLSYGSKEINPSKIPFGYENGVVSAFVYRPNKRILEEVTPKFREFSDFLVEHRKEISVAAKSVFVALSLEETIKFAGVGHPCPAYSERAKKDVDDACAAHYERAKLIIRDAKTDMPAANLCDYLV